MGFIDLSLPIHFSSYGREINEGFLKPVLGLAISYKRISSYFSVDTLISVASELDKLWHKQGEMKLIIGIHDVPKEIIDAAERAGDTDPITDYLIASIDSRLLTLMDAFEADKVLTVASMIKKGMLEIKVASTTFEMEGIFHQKSYLLEDEYGETIAAVGSPNETKNGTSSNFEEINIFKSWDASSIYVDVQAEKFEKIWNSNQEGLFVFDLDSRFADALTGKVTKVFNTKENETYLERLIDIAGNMPMYSIVSNPKCVLYPHQERTFIDALSRWPIRVLLADEVGLGKTIEAGSIIRYLTSICKIKRILVISPKNLMVQWQTEMYELFGIDFWIYDSYKSKCINNAGDTIDIDKSDLVNSLPEHSIISAQFARGTDQQGNVFANVRRWPDMIVFDEAHAARLRPSGDKTKPTLLWKMMEHCSNSVQHMLFLTATPMQLHYVEYHGLLKLLGLPEYWKKPEVHLRSLEILASGKLELKSLQEAHDVLMLIESSVAFYRPNKSHFNNEEIKLLDELNSEKDSIEKKLKIMSSGGLWYNLLVKVHPAHLMTIRNSKSVLSDFGYKFPERNLEAPDLIIDDNVLGIKRLIDRYLDEGYFSVEKELFNEARTNEKLFKINMNQRLASSLNASLITVDRRIRKLSCIKTDSEFRFGIEEEDASATELLENDVSISETVVGISRSNNALEIAINSEIATLELIRKRLLNIDIIEQDPKLQKMIEIVNKHLTLNDSILVFSKYTDTVDAAIEAFKRNNWTQCNFACFTGKECWYSDNAGRHDSSRAELRNMLIERSLKILFCSDAASEGLNLQSARVIINIDVPWNPARLEQRIGRIARIGQSALEVDIYNLWYPDSIEAKIYERLIQRKQLFELAVGEFSEIIGSAISDLVSKGDEDCLANEVIDQIRELRRSTQYLALKKVWDIQRLKVPQTRVLKDDLIRILRMAPNQKDKNSVVPVFDEKLAEMSLPELLELVKGCFNGRERGMGKSHLFVEGKGDNNTFLRILVEDNNTLLRVPQLGLSKLIASLVGLDSLSTWDTDYPVTYDIAESSIIEDCFSWLPNHAALVTSTSVDLAPEFDFFNENGMNVKPI